jgi:molybdopterin-guanine dinucleotide biosynthesis protein A
VSVATPVIGIFVGGEGRRMGGVAKGLLKVPGASEGIVERLVRIAREVAPPGAGPPPARNGVHDTEVVLVGSAASYAWLGCRTIDDATVGAGPLAGLVALLTFAGARSVIAEACDLPYVTSALLVRLAAHPASAAVVAPREDGLWQPLFARYDPARVLPAARDRLAARRLSLQGLLEEVGVEELPLAAGERALLRDWDSPEDMR